MYTEVNIILTCLILNQVSSELIDLTYTFNKNSPTSPKLNNFTSTVVKKGLDNFGNWVELNDYSGSEHSGTHLDAPVHFSRGKWSVEQIPNDHLFRVPGIKMDLRAQCKKGLNYQIRAEDLATWEHWYGTIPDGAVVLLETGWGEKVLHEKQYTGLDRYNKLNFPGLSIEAAKWLADHGEKNNHARGIIGVGVDTLSLDVGQSVDFPAHVKLLQKNIYGLENVANIHKLPNTDFLLTIMPMKIGGGSGAPARIIAETGSNLCSNCSEMKIFLPLLFVGLVTNII